MRTFDLGFGKFNVCTIMKTILESDDIKTYGELSMKTLYFIYLLEHKKIITETQGAFLYSDLRKTIKDSIKKEKKLIEQEKLNKKINV